MVKRLALKYKIRRDKFEVTPMYFRANYKAMMRLKEQIKHYGAKYRSENAHPKEI